MNAAQTKKAFLNGIWDTFENLYDNVLARQQGDGGSSIATAGNLPRGARGKAKTGTTRRGRRANTAANQPPNALS